MNDSPESRSPMAVAMAWVSRLTTISASMVLPGVLGYFVDSGLGTKALFTILGFAAGMGLGMWMLIRAAQSNQSK